MEAVAAAGDADDFVGHVGGDDFLVVTRAHRAEAVVREVVAAVPGRHRQVVGYEALDEWHVQGARSGWRPRHFPIARMSAAVVTVRPDQWISIGHLGELAADAKRRAKQQGAGTILVNAV